MQSLAARLTSALDAKTGATQAALARACNVTPASVADWFSGETKTIKAGPLLRAAKYLDVEPLWLLEGSGPRTRDSPDGLYTAHMESSVEEPRAIYNLWPFTADREQFDHLPPDDRARVDGFISATVSAHLARTPQKKRRTK